MYYIKFKDDKFLVPTLGKRAVPVGSIEVKHPDGTSIYLYEASQTDALMAVSRLSKLSFEDAKYYEYAYTEHILDPDHPDMFLLMLDDFKNWHTLVRFSG